MLSNKSSAVWASATSTQGVGETDWTAYQLSLTGNSQQFSLVPSQSTSISLVTYDGFNISSGQGLLLSTNGTSFTSGNAGAVSTTAPSTFVPAKVAGSSSAAASPITQLSTGTQGNGTFMKPDGTRFWTSNSGTLYEYSLATAFNLTTATTNGRTIASLPGSAICFSADGQYLLSSSAASLYVRQLSTAWDITTAGTAQTYSLSGMSGAGQLRISPDGVYVSAVTSNSVSPAGAVYVYQLTTPYQFATLNSTAVYTSSSYLPGASSLIGGFEFTPDGRTLIVFVANYASTPSGTIRAFSLTTPWNPATGVQLGSTYNLVMSDFNSPSSFNNGTFLCINPNGTQLYVGYNGDSTKGLATYTVDVNTKYNVNISSFGLLTAPTQAYYAAPSVSVDMETQANRVNMFPYQLDFTSATTTQAIVNAYGNASGGVLQTGDAILLNGTTSVTTTGVTQGTVNGVAAKNLGKTDNYISYSGKFGGIGVTNVSCIRFVPDGSSFIVYSQNAGQIVQYGLTIPWDISTIYGPIGVVNITSLPGGVFTAYTFGGCDFNADGSKLVVITYTSGTTATYAAEYNLAQKYYINSVISLAASNSLYIGTGQQPWGGRFNNNGTQFYARLLLTSTYYMAVLSCPTPYSIAGGSTTLVPYSSSYNTAMPLLEPNGNFLIGTGVYAGEQTLTVNNDITTVQNSVRVDVTTGGGQIPFTGGPVYTTVYAQEFSADGTKYYVNFNTPYIYQFNVRTRPLTQYTCTFATQASAPTSVSLPDRSTAQTITTAASGGNMTFSAPLVTAGGRAVAMKITSPYINTTITDATLALYKS